MHTLYIHTYEWNQLLVELRIHLYIADVHVHVHSGVLGVLFGVEKLPEFGVEKLPEKRIIQNE